MANLSIKDFDDDLYLHLKIAAAKERISLRDYIARTLATASAHPQQIDDLKKRK